MPADFALIDGNTARGFEIPTRTIVGGDAKCPSVAAASILAKVTRDRQCFLLDSLYPEYGFARHKGYPTKEHMAKVVELGPCPEHRRSFLSFAERMKHENHEVGAAGEALACEYLGSIGYSVICRNYRSGHLETDYHL